MIKGGSHEEDAAVRGQGVTERLADRCPDLSRYLAPAESDDVGCQAGPAGDAPAAGVAPGGANTLPAIGARALLSDRRCRAHPGGWGISPADREGGSRANSRLRADP